MAATLNTIGDPAHYALSWASAGTPDLADIALQKSQIARR
jgi:hypothetical protein